MHMEMGTDSRIQTTELSVDQRTLLSLLSADPGIPDPNQSWDVIFAHGPSHQGPRISLTVHVEP